MANESGVAPVEEHASHAIFSICQLHNRMLHPLNKTVMMQHYTQITVEKCSCLTYNPFLFLHPPTTSPGVVFPGRIRPFLFLPFPFRRGRPSSLPPAGDSFFGGAAFFRTAGFRVGRLPYRVHLFPALHGKLCRAALVETVSAAEQVGRVGRGKSGEEAVTDVDGNGWVDRKGL